MLKRISIYCMYSISKTSGVAAQLFSPKNCSQGPLMVICKKGFEVMLHLEDERPSKQNILIADTILAGPGL